MVYISNSPRTYKVCLIGDAKIGKTFLIKKLRYKVDPRYEYTSTIGCEVHSVAMNGNKYIIWDMSGNPNTSGLQDGYFIGAQHILIMSPNDIFPAKWVEKCGNIPYTIIDPKITREDLANILKNAVN